MEPRDAVAVRNGSDLPLPARASENSCALVLTVGRKSERRELAQMVIGRREGPVERLTALSVSQALAQATPARRLCRLLVSPLSLEWRVVLADAIRLPKRATPDGAAHGASP